MSYEPRGKMIDLIAAVRAAPQRAFTMKEVCTILLCKPFRSTVDQYVYAAIADGALFKREVDGVMYYAASAVSDSLLANVGIAVQPRNGKARLNPTGDRSPEEIAAALSDPRAPKFGEPWAPPRMVAPRPGSEQRAPRLNGNEASDEAELDARIRAQNTKINASAKETREADIREWIESANEVLVSKLAGAVADTQLGKRTASAATASSHEFPDSSSTPSADDAVVTGQERQPDAQASACEEATVIEVANRGDARAASGGCAQPEEEADEFNAALWLDGDLIIYGASETEDGGIIISREQVTKLKRLIAWSAP